MLEHPARRNRSVDESTSHAPARCREKSTCTRTRILIVEDDEVTGRVLVRLLSISGYEASHVEDYRAALKTACQWLPDVLVCDIDLHASRDGCDVLKTMRQGYPGLRALSVSGHDRRIAERESRRAGFQAHLCKPFDFEQLVEAIELILSTRQRPLRAAPAQAIN